MQYRRPPTSHPHPFLSTGIFSDTIRTPKLRRNRATLLLESPSLSSQPSTPATLNKSPLPIYSSQDPRQLLLFLASSRLVWFRSFLPDRVAPCNLQFLIHNPHRIGRLPATLRPPYHAETLIAKSQGLSEIHCGQAPHQIKQSPPQAPRPWLPPLNSIANIHRRRRIIRRRIINSSNINRLPRSRRAKVRRIRLPTAERSAFILKSRIRALVARTCKKPTPRRKRSVYIAKRIPR